MESSSRLSTLSDRLFSIGWSRFEFFNDKPDVRLASHNRIDHRPDEWGKCGSHECSKPALFSIMHGAAKRSACCIEIDVGQVLDKLVTCSRRISPTVRNSFYSSVRRPR